MDLGWETLFLPSCPERELKELPKLKYARPSLAIHVCCGPQDREVGPDGCVAVMELADLATGTE